MNLKFHKSSKTRGGARSAGYNKNVAALNAGMRKNMGSTGKSFGRGKAGKAGKVPFTSAAKFTPKAARGGAKVTKRARPK